MCGFAATYGLSCVQPIGKAAMGNEASSLPIQMQLLQLIWSIPISPVFHHGTPRFRRHLIVLIEDRRIYGQQRATNDADAAPARRGTDDQDMHAGLPVATGRSWPSGQHAPQGHAPCAAPTLGDRPVVREWGAQPYRHHRASTCAK